MRGPARRGDPDGGCGLVPPFRGRGREHRAGHITAQWRADGTSSAWATKIDSMSGQPHSAWRAGRHPLALPHRGRATQALATSALATSGDSCRVRVRVSIGRDQLTLGQGRGGPERAEREHGDARSREVDLGVQQRARPRVLAWYPDDTGASGGNVLPRCGTAGFAARASIGLTRQAAAGVSRCVGIASCSQR